MAKEIKEASEILKTTVSGFHDNDTKDEENEREKNFMEEEKAEFYPSIPYEEP